MRAGALMGDNPWFGPRPGTVDAREADARKGGDATAEPETAPRLTPTAAVRRWWSTTTAHASSSRA